MAHIWSGLSVHHLQTLPFRMKMLFSQRKDNVPKRHFSYNLGQEGSTMLLSEPPDQLSSMETFLGFNKENSTYTFWLFFSSPPRDATKLSLLGGDQELPNPFQQASVGTKGHDGPCCLVLLSF